MSELGPIIAELWSAGVGPDDRARLAALPEEARQGSEVGVFAALAELMTGGQAVVPAVVGTTATSRALVAAARVWAAALARDVEELARGLDALEPALAELEPNVLRPEPRAPIARAWADLALGEAALISADAGTARRRFEAVARSDAPTPLRIAAILRGVTLLLEKLDLAQAQGQCRAAVALATEANRPLHAQQARIAEAVLAYLAGDHATTREILTAEAAGPLGLVPRILLASFEPAERAMPLLAEGLADAATRGDALAYTLCTIVGAHRYAALDRDADALLTLSAAIAQLRDVAAGCATALEDARTALRRDWGEARYAAAERAAIELLDRG